MWCRLAWLAVLASLLLGGRWAAASEPANVLDEMRLRQVTASFHGSFIYERSDLFSTHEVWISRNRGGHHERYVRQNGPYFEIQRRNGELLCMTPGVAPVTGKDAIEFSQAPEPMGRIIQSYLMQPLGNSRVASRVTEVLLFVPQDEHRFPLEMHLDRETGVVLKSLLLDREGTLLERFQYVEFTPGLQPKSAFAVDKQHCAPVTPAKAPAPFVGAVQWQAGWLPDGFLRAGETADSQVYSDGLARISLFVAKLEPGQTAGRGPYQMGATAIASHVLTTRNGQWQITVLGEVPTATAERIALSVRLLEQPDD